MASMTTHHGIKIYTLEDGEQVLDHCGPEDIAVRQGDDGGWWTCFVDDDGNVETYDQPFETLSRALGAARAAAENMAE